MVKVKSIQVVWEDKEILSYDTHGELYDYKLCKKIFKSLLKRIKQKEREAGVLLVLCGQE